jgi:hypothetical protein
MIVLLQVTTVILISLFQFNSCQYEEEEKLKNKFKTYIEDVEDQRPRIPIKQIYANLKTTISSVKKSCGQVCDQSVPGIPGKYYDFIEKKVDCKSIFSNPDIDDPAQFLDPPTRIPKWLAPEYTYGGRVDIANFYRDDAQGQSHYTNWTLELDEYILEMYRKKQLTGKPKNAVLKIEIKYFSTELSLYNNLGPYGKDAVDNIINYIKTQVDVKDKHVLVLGSQTPWIELILLEHGAKKVTAVDYIKIHSEHEQIEAMTAYELNEKYLKGTLPQYDVYVSFSSLEHAGLGR